MTSPRTVIFAVLGWLLATTAVAQDDRGVRRVSIRDEEGQEVAWYEGSYALLIGVSDYTAGWPDLESVPGELVEVRQALEAHGFRVEKAPDDPTADELKTAVEDFIDAYGFGRRNRLLVFFSGHGYSFPDDNRGFLVPSDAPDPRVDRTGFLRKALHMSQVLAWARQIDAPHVLFLFDSCFSGTVFKARSPPEVPPHIAAATAKPVRQFVSAGSAGQQVPAKSVFTPHFARALRGRADLDDDGYVTGTELGMYLHKEVLGYGQGQTPQYGKIRDPDLDEGDFVFRLSRRAPAPPAVTAPPVEKPTIADLLDQAAEIERVKAQWADRLATLRQQVAQAEDLESRDVPVSLKVEVWQRLVDGYTEDDPYSTEDDRLRERARERLAHWRRAVPVSAGTVSLFTASSPPSAGDVLRDPMAGMRLRYVPGGRFRMGSPPDEKGRFDAETLHDVELMRGFWMGETEVTQGQWRQLMGNNPSRFSSCGDDCPVETVSWWDAVTYANRLSSQAGLEICYELSGCSGTPGEEGYSCQSVDLKGLNCQGYRLPTEAEWERAARAGSQETPYWTGGNLTTNQANFEEKHGATVRVRSFAANYWGLYEVHGNVWEWVWDRYGTYPTGLVRDPVGPAEGSRRVFRGGSWYDIARYARAAFRLWYEPGVRLDLLGFRLARGQGE